jgi:pimeloyl-ACP methyl ester carboxylesterase
VKLQRHDLTETLEAVACPTLFVAGEHDSVAPPASVVAASDGVRNASLVRVPASHYGALDGEELDRTLRYELAFLDAEL